MIVIKETVNSKEDWDAIEAKYPGLTDFIGEPPYYPTELDFSLNHIPDKDYVPMLVSPAMLEVGKYVNMKTGDTLVITGNEPLSKKKEFWVKIE